MLRLRLLMVYWHSWHWTTSRQQLTALIILRRMGGDEDVLWSPFVFWFLHDDRNRLSIWSLLAFNYEMLIERQTSVGLSFSIFISFFKYRERPCAILNWFGDRSQWKNLPHLGWIDEDLWFSKWIRYLIDWKDKEKNDFYNVSLTQAGTSIPSLVRFDQVTL